MYRVSNAVKSHDRFWLRGQKYSLCYMLNRNEGMSTYFAGESVYQVLLSPGYQHWHASTIGKFEVIDGTYYAVLPDDRALADDPDLPVGSPYGTIIHSQSFITLAATRALIYIKADNPDIGHVCFIGFGIVVVSTCDVTVKEGQYVEVGKELGMFHFGDPSNTLVFTPECGSCHREADECHW